MRLLLIGHEYPPTTGGAGAAMHMLATRLADRGHAVHVLTVGPSGEAHEDGVAVHRFNTLHHSGPGRWAALLTRGRGALRRAVQDFKPDLVNAHFIVPAGGLAGRVLGGRVPLVISAVGADIHDPTRRVSPDRSGLLRRLTRRAVSRARVVTTPSTDLTDRLLALTPGADVRTIPWGFVPPAHEPAAMPIDTDKFVIATVGRLVERKRIDLLIDAVAALNDQRIELYIAGDGPRRDALTHQAQALGVSQRVRFLGRVSDDDKHALLRRADVFCLPSEHEGFGIALLEAMAQGCPVVTTDTGGQSDFIRDGVEGLLVPVGSSAALVQAIAGLADQPEKCAQMARRAGETAQRFTAEQTALAFESLFERVVTG